MNWNEYAVFIAALGSCAALVMRSVSPMVNVTLFDGFPSGFRTLIDATPMEPRKVAGTAAVSCVADTNVVTSGELFQ